MPSQGGDNTKQNNQQSVSSEHVEDVDGFHSPPISPRRSPTFCNLAQLRGAQKRNFREPNCRVYCRPPPKGPFLLVRLGEVWSFSAESCRSFRGRQPTISAPISAPIRPRNASSGARAIGSPRTLKLVFTKTGQPVLASKAAISARF